MQNLEAGSSYVIAEAREAGNVGIYRGTGEVREGLVQEILTQIPGERIMWEAPQKAQQLYFLELLGCNVNLGNIATYRSNSSGSNANWFTWRYISFISQQRNCVMIREYGLDRLSVITFIFTKIFY